MSVPSSINFLGNIFYTEDAPLIGERTLGVAGVRAHNVWWNPKGAGEKDFAGLSSEEYQSKGGAYGDVVADPLFVDAKGGDFRLKPESPALKLGFRPFDFTAAGPRMIGLDAALLYKADGVVGTGAGWRLVREEKGKVVYIPFEGYYESKGGRIESEKFDLKGARFARLTFSAKAAEPGFWWVDLFGEDGKALPDVNSRIYASDDWRKYEEMVPISGAARQGQLAFVSEKGMEVRDIRLEGVSAETAAAWCYRLYATLPQIEVGDLSAAWSKLPCSRERILSGKPLRVVLLGDSIVNDTYCGNVAALVQREFPNVEFILSVRGSTGCWYYRDPKHFEEYVLAHKPDLVLVGGISNGKDEADFSTAEEDMVAVIELAKKSGIEIAVMSPPPSYEWRNSPEDTTWDENFVHARYEAWAKKVKHWQPLRRDYQRAATGKTGVAYWDLTTAPCEAIAKSGKPLNWFHRDTCHNDDRGKQLIAQVLAANFRVLIKTR